MSYMAEGNLQKRKQLNLINAITEFTRGKAHIKLETKGLITLRQDTIVFLKEITCITTTCPLYKLA